MVRGQRWLVLYSIVQLTPTRWPSVDSGSDRAETFGCSQSQTLKQMHVGESGGALSLPHGRGGGSGRGKFSILVAAPPTRAVSNDFLNNTSIAEVRPVFKSDRHRVIIRSGM